MMRMTVMMNTLVAGCGTGVVHLCFPLHSKCRMIPGLKHKRCTKQLLSLKALTDVKDKLYLHTGDVIRIVDLLPHIVENTRDLPVHVKLYCFVFLDGLNGEIIE